MKYLESFWFDGFSIITKQNFNSSTGKTKQRVGNKIVTTTQTKPVTQTKVTKTAKVTKVTKTVTKTRGPTQKVQVGGDVTVVKNGTFCPPCLLGLHSVSA